MNILIVDDHNIVREGLKEVLKQLTGVNSIEVAGRGREALEKVGGGDIDLVILDISLPDISGIEVLERIKERHPGVKVLILSMHPQELYAIRAMKMGASGYLTKDTPTAELLAAINKISSGGKYISQTLAEIIADHLDNESYRPLHETLSEREMAVFIRLARGKSLKEIGEELFISEKTVSTYRSRAISKMGMKNNAEIAHYCIKNGFIE